jgi:hypothetical protein
MRDAGAGDAALEAFSHYYERFRASGAARSTGSRIPAASTQVLAIATPRCVRTRLLSRHRSGSSPPRPAARHAQTRKLGWSDRTVRSAKEPLKLVSDRAGWGAEGIWSWRLADADEDGEDG